MNTPTAMVRYYCAVVMCLASAAPCLAAPPAPASTAAPAQPGSLRVEAERVFRELEQAKRDNDTAKIRTLTARYQQLEQQHRAAGGQDPAVAQYLQQSRTIIEASTPRVSPQPDRDPDVATLRNATSEDGAALGFDGTVHRPATTDEERAAAAAAARPSNPADYIKKNPSADGTEYEVHIGPAIAGLQGTARDQMVAKVADELLKAMGKTTGGDTSKIVTGWFNTSLRDLPAGTNLATTYIVVDKLGALWVIYSKGSTREKKRTTFKFEKGNASRMPPGGPGRGTIPPAEASGPVDGGSDGGGKGGGGRMTKGSAPKAGGGGGKFGGGGKGGDGGNLSPAGRNTMGGGRKGGDSVSGPKGLKKEGGGSDGGLAGKAGKAAGGSPAAGGASNDGSSGGKKGRTGGGIGPAGASAGDGGAKRSGGRSGGAKAAAGGDGVDGPKGRKEGKGSRGGGFAGGGGGFSGDVGGDYYPGQGKKGGKGGKKGKQMDIDSAWGDAAVVDRAKGSGKGGDFGGKDGRRGKGKKSKDGDLGDPASAHAGKGAVESGAPGPKERSGKGRKGGTGGADARKSGAPAQPKHAAAKTDSAPDTDYKRPSLVPLPSDEELDQLVKGKSPKAKARPAKRLHAKAKAAEPMSVGADERITDAPKERNRPKAAAGKGKKKGAHGKAPKSAPASKKNSPAKPETAQADAESAVPMPEEPLKDAPAAKSSPAGAPPPVFDANADTPAKVPLIAPPAESPKDPPAAKGKPAAPPKPSSAAAASSPVGTTTSPSPPPKDSPAPKP
ncbi:MAG: hypothetical protein HY078_16560 [Elusimicrobia bacterium]|nr:hypothetical protein [Elusimicrobiota bacterium]